MSFYWKQHKYKLEAENFILIIYEKFKVFFYCSLGNFKAFIDNFWQKIKQNF